MAKRKGNQTHQSKPVLSTQEMTPMQMEILDMFAHKKLNSDEEEEIKDLLSNYFLNKAQQELEALADEENWDLKKKSEVWAKDKLRTPYRSEGNS